MVYEDGSCEIRDRSVRAWFISVRVRLTKAQRDAFRTWMITKCHFRKTPFSFTPDANMDFGKGDGVACTTCYLWQDAYIEKQVAHGRYEVSLLIRTVSADEAAPS